MRLPHAPTAAQALARVLAVCSPDVVDCAHQRTLVGVVIIVGKQAGSQSIVERALAQQHAAAAVGVGGTVICARAGQALAINSLVKAVGQGRRRAMELR